MFGISGELEKSKAKVAGADKHNIMLALHTSYILFAHARYCFILQETMKAEKSRRKPENHIISLFMMFPFFCEI